MTDYGIIALAFIAAICILSSVDKIIAMRTDRKLKKRIEKLEESVNNVDKAQTD